MSERSVQDEMCAVEVVIQQKVVAAAMEILKDVHACLEMHGLTLQITHRFEKDLTHEQQGHPAVVVSNSRGIAFRIGSQRYTMNGTRSGYWGNVKQIAHCLWCSSIPTAFGSAW